ncbi:MAG TPA: protease inhibitor I42 family protein [Spirochaetota bacterium]|nr:protease inhibitor I42 family protein [Spirochaetota bacterium]
MKKTIVIASLIILLFGCVSSRVTKSGKSFDPNLILDETSDTIIVKNGEKFQFILHGNYTTGYSWILSDDYDKSLIKLTDRNYEVTRKNVSGSPGVETFFWKALKNGKTTISLIYKRSWEKEEIDAKKVKYDIVIEK